MKLRRTALLCALFLLLTACRAETDPSVASMAPAEGERLVIYTSHKKEVYGPIVKEFEERTGIWTQVVTGGTNELLEQIAAEREKPRCDVMFGGGVESLLSYVDCFEPYESANAALLKPGLRPEGDVWTPFSALPVVLIYNTRLVSARELTGWADLMDSRWRGKIAFADPAVSGSSYTAVVTCLSCLPGDDWEELEQFAEQLDGSILSDSGDVVTAVAAGSCAVGITLEETALKRQAQGVDIGIVYPVEGTSSVPDGTALIAGAPHRDNAAAFLEFVQSTDVQQLVVSDFFRRSVRTDVDDRDALAAFKVMDYDVARASGMKEEFLSRWQGLNREVGP